MSFDAGSITATLTLDTSKFDADLAKEKAKLDDLTKPREVRLSAVFDNASLSKARKAFADLDNMISRDAAQRLKSSPQGSVLGALNSLFSPHPVSGAPSPQASAASGLLGKMISQQGGGGQAGPAGNQGTAGSNARQVLQGGGPQGNQTSNDYIRQILTGQGAANQETTDKIKQVLTGQTPGNLSTEDMIKQVVTGTTPGNIKTEDLITPKVAGKLPGDYDTTDTVHEKIDEADKAKLITDSGDAGDKAGASFSASFSSHIKSLLDSVTKMGSGGGSSGSGGLAGGLLGGIGPGILGLSAKVTSIVGAVGSALATLPALAGVAGLGIGTALIGGAVAGVIASSPALKAQLKTIGGDAETMFTQAAKPLIPAISAVLNQVPALLAQIGPQLTGIFKTIAPQVQGIFSGLIPVIKGVLGIMQAAAPAFGPVIQGLESLVANILPGIETVIKAAVPFASEFAGILGTLGKDLGQFFAAAAPAIGASMTVLRSLLELLGSLLPPIMSIADAFAKALAPVFTQFASAIKALTPFLTTLGGIIAQLAKAVLGDLSGAFQALGQLLVAIAPSLNTLGKALGQVFQVLENSGVFAILGDALESIVPPLAKFVNTLVSQLAPFLPTVIGLVGKLAGIFTTVLAAGLTTILTGITDLAKKFPFLVPLIAGAAAAFWLLNIAMDANPIGAVIIGVVALVGAITELVGHWSTVWGAIKSVAGDAWSWLYGNVIGPMVNWFTVSLPNAWSEAYTGFQNDFVDPFKTAFGDMRQWIYDDFILPVGNFFTVTIPGWWHDVIGFLQADLVQPFENGIKAMWDWVVGNVWDPVDTFFTSTLPGYFDTAVNFTQSHFVTPFENAIKGGWDWVVTNVWDPMETFVTKTIPGWFDTAVSGISTAWGKIESAVEGPVNFVIGILNDLINAFDTITSALGLGKPIPDISTIGGGSGSTTATTGAAGTGGSSKATAQHGMLVPGYGGGDNHLILAEGGELILPKEASSDPAAVALAKRYGVPGFTSGGIIPGIVGIVGKAALGALEQLVPGLSVGAALTSAAIGTALGKFADMGSGGAGGVLGQIITAIPKKIVSDMESWLAGHAKPAAAAGGGAGGSSYTTTGAGDYSLSQLEALWIQAGGNPAVAYNMARIAIAESGGDPNAYNPSGATGLWQILGAVLPGNLYNPLVNAENAVAKYAAGGYAPWESDPVAAGLLGMAGGGMISEPVIGFGTNTGQGYVFGEHGPEMVTPGRGASIADVVARLERLIDVTGSLPHGISGNLGAALGGAAMSASMHTRYPRGGA